MKNFCSIKAKLTLCALLFFLFCRGQRLQHNTLEEIVLQGSFASEIQSGYYQQSIPDSILKVRQLSLGDLLEDQSNLYFKQNGNGMVSSIALRGTTASQTGVYWNGIAINSSLNGQTDFNTLSASGFDKVKIRRGGGSVLLGSGAVGGAINLQDEIIFENDFTTDLSLELGSYQTYGTHLVSKISNKKWFGKIGLGGFKSENDYPYLDSDLKNENGAYKYYNTNLVLGYQLNSRNYLNFYTSYFNNDRDNSRTISAPSNSNLKNEDLRLLADWKYLGDTFTSTVKAAYLHEKYRYYADKNLNNYSFGKSNAMILKYDFTYFLNQSIFIRSGVEYKNLSGNGSDILDVEQNEFSVYALFNHQLFNNFKYDVSLRKGFSDATDIPFIYAIDANYQLTANWNLRGNYANNFRQPTFNDLYWNPGGNLDLKSEKSNSFEVGVDFAKNILAFHLTGFFINSKDMIQWQPISGTIWQPVNVQSVHNHGLEFSAIAEKKWQAHELSLSIQYDYTVATDQNTKKQLIYVPYHKANSIINYNFKQWRFVYQLKYTGKVYTTTTNTQEISDYWLSNISIGRNIFKGIAKVSFRVENLFDTFYESVAYRPMPNRNYTINLNIKL